MMMWGENEYEDRDGDRWLGWRSEDELLGLLIQKMSYLAYWLDYDQTQNGNDDFVTPLGRC